MKQWRVGFLATSILLRSNCFAQGAASPPGCDFTGRAGRDIPCSVDRGVEHWVASVAGEPKPRFFTGLESLSGLRLPDRGELPFGRSVAFLAGVSTYSSFEPLPFVRDDLIRFREYLLSDGGFDEVFLVRDEQVTVELINDYMMGRFVDGFLRPEDRLLFYFSGHGMEAPGGRTGLIAFKDAKKGDFVHHVIPVNTVYYWSDNIPAAHVLFILDSCSSGLGIGQTKGDSAAELLNSLSRTGSRAIMTAGTSRQKTFGLEANDGKGTSVFTFALLTALSGTFYAGPIRQLMTADTVCARVKEITQSIAAEKQRTLSPHCEPIREDSYPGSFVFLNPASTGESVDARLAKVLKGENPNMPGQPIQSIAKASDLALAFADGSQRRTGALSYTLEYGRLVGQPRTVVLAIENLSSQEKEVSIRTQGDSLEASFPGGGWSTSVRAGKAAELQVTFQPARYKSGEAIRFYSGDQPLFGLSPHFVEVEGRRRIVRDSEEKDSGPGEEFSGPYDVCLDPPPAGYSLARGTEEFWLTGDRKCGAWATCELVRPAAEVACMRFRLQGHDEMFPWVRRSTGHIAATYIPKADPVELFVDAP
jgi:hypothetical protein